MTEPQQRASDDIFRACITDQSQYTHTNCIYVRLQRNDSLNANSDDQPAELWLLCLTKALRYEACYLSRYDRDTLGKSGVTRPIQQDKPGPHSEATNRMDSFASTHTLNKT